MAQDAKKIIFIACHSGKLKLAFTSPDITWTSPKSFWRAELISQFFLYSNCSKNITCPSGKLKREFTIPITKSTSPGLSDTTFFACWMVNFEPGEYMRNMIFQSVTQAAWKKKIRVLPIGGQTYDILVTSPDALPLSHRRRFGAKFMWQTSCM